MEATILWLTTMIFLALCLGLWAIGNFNDLKDLLWSDNKKGEHHDAE